MNMLSNDQWIEIAETCVHLDFDSKEPEGYLKAIRADERAKLVGSSVEPAGWVCTAKEGPGVYDPMLLLGKSVATGYVSGYIPVYTAEAIAARVAQAQAEIDTLSKTCGLAVVERDALRAENEALLREAARSLKCLD